MKRFLVAVSASLLLILALVAPVAAKGSCKEFGATTATWAHASGGVGHELSVFATSGPGTISGIVAGEHLTMCGN
jgi:hypothetical protein